MNTKIVYVLVSTEKDVYLEQAMLSIYSLRLHQPDAYVMLFVDDITDQTLKGKRENILSMVDEKIVVKRENAVSSTENAYSLKTTFRESIKGDFLYLDSDTIITDKLEDIDNCPFDVAAVPDAHMSFIEHFGHGGYVDLFKDLGFELKSEYYYNSGVIFVRDTPKAHDLYKAWNEPYKLPIKKCYFDQPHLARANNDLKVISTLDGVWNCQVMWGINYLQRAKVIHYFASNFIGSHQQFPYRMMDKSIFYKIKENGGINEEVKLMLTTSKELWVNKIEVLGGKDVDLQHSRLMKVVRNIYYSKNKLYSLIEVFLGFMAKMKHLNG